MTRFLIMLYVNRSGSTLASRLLSEASDELFVFPELAFPLWLLFERRFDRPHAAAELCALISSDPRIDALPLSSDQLRAICEAHCSGDLAELLEAIATACLGRCPRTIGLKLERFADHPSLLASALRDPLIVHLVRDPRAVVSSMMRAPVPEKPGFTMARDDVLFAARYWRDYVRKVGAAAERRPVMQVRYEDLTADPDAAIRGILRRLGLHDSARPTASAYRTSALDRELHPNVFAPIMPSRAAAWRDELAPSPTRLIEHICRREMRALGYAVAYPPAPAGGAAMLIPAYLDHWQRSVVHAVRSAARYARRPDRSVALGRRLREALAKPR